MSRREEYNRLTGKHLPDKDTLTLKQIRQWQQEIQIENRRLVQERRKKEKDNP
jgi:hypothetical protein